VSDALSDFERLRPRASQVVEMRVFRGFQMEEIGEALGVTPTTVKRDWEFARAWLYGRIHTRPGEIKPAAGD
jgi:RNA polymerase sigma factor (sigma-70 family)